MPLSQDDILAIARALRDNKVDEALAQQAGVESKNDQGPVETPEINKPSAVPSTATGPTPKQPEASASDLQVNQGTPRPSAGLQAFNILEIASRIAFVKEIEHEVSTFVPSAHRMYAILHELDSLLVQNRYFRQSVPSFLPTQSRIYCGILFLMQVVRCMDHVGILTSLADRHTFTEFFRRHPVATLPVPGPILPVLQSLCVSSAQDGTLPRVTPTLPSPLGPTRADSLIQSAANFALPNIPMMFGLHERLRAIITTAVTGNVFPDSSAVLTAFGYQGTASASQITINGRDFPIAFTGMNADHLWASTCPGIGQPLELNDELVVSFKSNNRFINFPVLSDDANIANLSTFTRVMNGPWFSTLKRNMAIYCRYIKGSGTMQDISVEGPASGQIVSQVVTTEIATPTGFFTQENLFPGDASYTTTQPANDRIAELGQVYSQTHIRVANHPHDRYNQIGSDNENTGRNGTFWDVRPVRPPTTTDHVKDSLAEELSFYVRERADKD